MSKKNPGARTRVTMAEAMSMAKIRDIEETVAARVQNGPAFAQALLDEAVTLFVHREPESRQADPTKQSPTHQCRQRRNDRDRPSPDREWVHHRKWV
ncbi:MAG: hypothetical protein LT106_00845 [Burkholderiaceae bacterium]|nr:hypothetical protein [Burkholderiaceae bacterium]